MKKNKDRPTDQGAKAVKRKSEGDQNGTLKLKKRKKLLQSENQGSFNKTQNITLGTSNLKEGKEQQKKKKTASVFQESPKVIKGPGSTQAVNAEGLKKKKKKNKLNQGTSNVSSASEGTEISSDIKKKKKKKKNKLNQGTSNVSPASEGTEISSDIKKKKKKKNKLNQGTSNVSPASEATEISSDIKKKKKKKKNKLNQSTSNVSPASEGTEISSDIKKKKKKKKKNKLNQETLNTSSASDGNKKKSNFGKSQGTKNTQTKPLSEGASKKLASKYQKSISRLTNFKNKQEALLLKSSKPKEKIKIESRIKQIEQQIQKLQKALPSNEFGKINTTEVVNKRKFVGLPEDPPPTKTKQKRVELKDFLQNQMKASRFRWLNENLYTSSSEEAQNFFKEDPESFKAYHDGYSEQVSKWPINPVDVIIKELKSSPKNTVVADLGCGEAKLAAGLPHLKVHSLDFIALKPEVTACDMAHCPLLRSSVDVAVFCLSLMGTNVGDFLIEANRILKTGGTMEIAEVESRFESIDDFIEKVQKYGFQLKKKSPTDMFFFLTFKKTQDVTKSGKLPEIDLKACVYKKR